MRFGMVPDRPHSERSTGTVCIPSYHRPLQTGQRGCDGQEKGGGGGPGTGTEAATPGRVEAGLINRYRGSFLRALSGPPGDYVNWLLCAPTAPGLPEGPGFTVSSRQAQCIHCVLHRVPRTPRALQEPSERANEGSRDPSSCPAVAPMSPSHRSTRPKC